MNRLLGLIGYPLSHSFSKEYFNRKFEQEGITGYTYELFPLKDISELPALLRENPGLTGLNVTIPHKIAVLPFLEQLDETAAAIGAVNTIRIRRREASADGGRGFPSKNAGAGIPENLVLSGYNTDAWGFKASLQPLLRTWHKKALILGTGGASKAVLYVLRTLGIEPLFVSRRPPGAGRDQAGNAIGYRELDDSIIREYPLIVNTTPLGTFPDTDRCPDIPYDSLSEQNLLYDLVYNPAETLFLKKGKEKGAATMNGMEMLRLQAEKAWEIWTSKD